MASRVRELPAVAEIVDWDMTAKEMRQQLEKGLQIDPDALDEALIRQPDLFYRVSSQLAMTISRRDQAKQELAEIEAETDLKIRHDAEVTGDKVTVAEVEARKLLNPKVKMMRVDLLELNSDVGELSALKEAFQQRAYALKDLASLYVAGYFGDSQPRSAANAVREHDAGVSRRAMAEARKGR